MNGAEVTKGVIPVAGWGTRNLPATKAQPKEMLPIIDTPLVELVVQELLDSNIKNILMITGRGKNAIEDHFAPNPELERLLERKGDIKGLELVRKSTQKSIHYIRQHEQRGLGDAVRYAENFVDGEPFMLLLGDAFFVADVPVTKQMIEKYKNIGKPLVALEEVGEDKLSSYGIAKVEPVRDGFLITDLVEKPGKELAEKMNLGVNGKYYAIIGWYLLEPSIFGYLSKVKEDSRGEIQITDALKLMAQNGHMYGIICKGRRYDIGTKWGYYEAILHAGLRHADISKAAEAEIIRLAREIAEKKQT